MVNQIFDLEDGEVQCYNTNYSDFVMENEERLLKEFQAHQEQQKQIKKRLHQWGNRSDNADLYKRARSMEKALERMEKLDRLILKRKKMHLHMESSARSGKDVMILKDVSMSYGERQLFDRVNMHMAFQQKVVIVRENGTGKPTLLKLILQQLTPDEGEVR